MATSSGAASYTTSRGTTFEPKCDLSRRMPANSSYAEWFAQVEAPE